MNATTGEELRAEALWVIELDRLVGIVQHDLRNVMQAAGINIEVLRSRTHSETPDLQARDLRNFSDAASRQFDILTARVEALSGFCRQSSGAPDLNGIMQCLEILLRTNRAGSMVVYPAGAPVPVDLTHSGARALVVHLALAHLGEGDPLVCRIRGSEPYSVEFSWRADRGGTIDAEVLRLATDLQVGIRTGDRCVTLTFPTRLRSDTVLT
jgi:signal transduction histidine kinase